MKIHHFNGMKTRKGGDFHGDFVSFREGTNVFTHIKNPQDFFLMKTHGGGVPKVHS